MTTPRFLMPAEWEKQARIWLAWPHNRADWPDRFAPIPWAYGEIIKHITRTQRVGLVVKNVKARQQASILLDRIGVEIHKIDFVEAPTNRVWLRDSGAIFVRDLTSGKKVALDWKFNAWAKYKNHVQDNRMPKWMAEFSQVERVQPTWRGKAIVLEGGSIDVNGAGCILTTEECLLSEVQERNPGFVREDYEAVFAEFLGATKTIWLNKGIEGDDTHGHVDDLARFTDANTIVTVVESNKASANYAPLQENLERLKRATDVNGKPFAIAELPMPKPIICDSTVLPASYANFLICNEVVLVPVFNDANDRIALNVLAELFPSREIVGVYAGDFVWGLGTIHCASQQEIL